MTVRFDYKKDRFSVDGIYYSLAGLRDYLLADYPGIILSHRVKKIFTEGDYRWTYDWDAIYFKAKQSNLIKEYVAAIRNKEQEPTSGAQ